MLKNVSGIICLRTAPHKSPPIFLHDLSKRNVKLAIGQAKISVFNTDHQVQRSHWDLLSRLLRTHKCTSRQILGVRRIFARKIFRPLFVHKDRISDDLQKQNVFMWFWAPFFQIKARWAPFLHAFSVSLRRLSKILPIFLLILPGFLQSQKFWGCACTPASYTTVGTVFKRSQSHRPQVSYILKTFANNINHVIISDGIFVVLN